jgi:hypothetical protein
MARHYYARYETKDHELRNVIRFADKATRDEECSPCMQDDSGWLVPIGKDRARREMRELYGLEPHERFFGELVWIGALSPVVGSPCETVCLRTH